MRIQVIENGVVINTLEAASLEVAQSLLPEAQLVHNEQAGIDWSYDGQDFFAPTPPEPSTNPADYPLRPWQFKAMVLYLNKDTAIRAAIENITDPLQRAVALSRYENATAYNYDDPFLHQMRVAVSMSEQELTDAWMIAKDLKSGA